MELLSVYAVEPCCIHNSTPLPHKLSKRGASEGRSVTCVAQRNKVQTLSRASPPRRATRRLIGDS